MEAYKHYYIFMYMSGIPKSRLLKRRPPFTSYKNTYTTERAAYGNQRAMNGDRTSYIQQLTEPIHLRKSVISLSFPTLLDGLDLPI